MFKYNSIFIMTCVSQFFFVNMCNASELTPESAEPVSSWLPSEQYTCLARLFNKQACKVLESHSGITAVSFNPKKKSLAVGSYEGKIRVWNFEIGESLELPEFTFNPIRYLHYEPKIEEYRELVSHRAGAIYSLCYDPKNYRLAAGSLFRLWIINMYNKKPFKVLQDDNGPFTDLCYNPSGSQFFSGVSGSCFNVSLWDAKTGRSSTTSRGYAGPINCICCEPTVYQCATGSDDSIVRIWDIKTGKQLKVLEGHSEPVCSLCWNHNGARLASGSHDTNVRIWDIAAAKSIILLRGHTGAVTACHFNHDSTRLASGSDDGTVCLWDATKGELLHACTGHYDKINCLAFDKTGMLLATGSDDCTIRLWDIREIENFVGICGSLHRGVIDLLQRICIAIEHDGRINIEAGSEDESIFNTLPPYIGKLLKKQVLIMPEHAECSICYEDVSRQGMVILDCGHIFHDKCIACWREKGCDSCPFCNQ
jgi:WD40 repeat protein